MYFCQYLNQFKLRIIIRSVWNWPFGLKTSTHLTFNNSTSKLVVSKTENLTTEPTPSNQYEDRELRRIVSSLNTRRKTNLENIAKFLDARSNLISHKVRERVLLYIASSRCQTVPSSLFFIDPVVAKQVYISLRPHFLRYKGHVLEANAGPGMLSYLLMRARLKKLRIYDSHSGFFEALVLETERLKSSARVYEYNLLRLRWMMQRDLEDKEDRIKTIFEGIEPQPWEAEPVLKMFIILPHETFLVLQMFDLLMQNGIYSLGRPEYFVIIPSVNFQCLSTFGQLSSSYKPMLFNILFEYTVLDKHIPEMAILPWRYKRKQDRKWMKEGQEDCMILVQITPRKDLFDYVKPDQLKPLLFFIKILFLKPADKLIPTLEKWVPGFGVQLIPLGYTIYTKCKSLNPEQVLELFKLFISSPEFLKESFYTMMEHDLMKSLTLQEMLMSSGKNKDSDIGNSKIDESSKSIEPEIEKDEEPLDEDEQVKS